MEARREERQKLKEKLLEEKQKLEAKAETKVDAAIARCIDHLESLYAAVTLPRTRSCERSATWRERERVMPKAEKLIKGGRRRGCRRRWRSWRPRAAMRACQGWA